MIRARATIHGLEGGLGVMTIYCQGAVGPDNSALAALTSSRLHDAIDTFKARLANSVSYVGDTVAQSLNPATGALQAEYGVDPWTVTGTVSDAQLPGASQACIGWATGVAIGGRMLRGRTFVAGISRFSLAGDGGILTETQTLLNAMATAWNDAGTSDCVAGVWHRPRSGSGGSFHGISGWTIPTKFAVLRSRRD